MRGSVRLRLTLWHSAFLTALVVAFAIASYTFLEHTELRRVDSTLHEQSEIVTQSMQLAGIGVRPSKRADTAEVLASLHDLRARGLRVWLFDGSNRSMMSTAMVHEGEGPREEQAVLGDTLPTAALQSAIAMATSTASAGRGFQTVDTRHGGVRVFASRLPPAVGVGTVVLAYPLRELRQLLARARNAAITAVGLAVLVSVFGGYVLARRSLAPVSEMRQQADRIGANNLHERLPVANAHDELGRLAGTFNSLLDRVTTAFEQQRRFMADASHELRTPVAIMRSEAEVALGVDSRSREDYRDALEIVRDASDRLTRTVNDVFLLARVDAGQVPAAPARLEFSEVVSDTCRSLRSLVQARGIALTVDAPSEIVYVGDEALLARLVTNLVDNAIKYSNDGGAIGVRLTADSTGVRLTVSNTGPGIPEESREHVFERFYRADAARAFAADGKGSGSGLGLSIARWIAEVHGGTLELTIASEAITVFTLCLPTVPVLSA